MIKSLYEHVLAVIVLYNSRLEDCPAFSSLAQSLKQQNVQLELLVYDNSPVSINKHFEHDDSTTNLDYWKIHYLHDPSNPGVSYAYNEGYRMAKLLDKKWLWLIDQDTTFPVNTLAKYWEAIEKFPAEVLFVPVLKAGNQFFSPCRYYFKRGFHLKKIGAGRHSVQSKSVLNSGMLIKAKGFEKAGGFNDHIKLDFSDFAFMDRFRKFYPNFVVVDLVCNHKMSTLENTTIQSSLQRFGMYCDGAQKMQSNSNSKLIYLLITFTRGLKLSIKFRTLKFISYYFSFWFKQI